MCSFYNVHLSLNIMIWCKSLLVCFSIIHCDANCFNPVVSAGLCCTYVYTLYCLVARFRGPQGRIVMLAYCVTLNKNCINN